MRLADVLRGAPHRLDLACLLVAAETLPAGRAAGPALDRYLDAGLAALDGLAARVPDSGPAHRRLQAALAGFGGGADDYALLESSLLPHVLRRRRGLPILLSVVWTEVARRRGLPAYGVGLPGHFVVGVGDPDGDRVLVDPSAGGALLPLDAARARAEAAGGRLSPVHLRPADPRATLARVLANVRRWAAGRPEGFGAGLWAAELGLLVPAAGPGLRRERAEALVAAGRFAAGADALLAYADEVAATMPLEAGRARGAARSARARLS